ncbi:FAD-dependent oxidoreductase [uncultured Victivallis sp.]|uniref:FAD-dependent oxidoreductase n=1 Tax=uncultured Victivallis sp. TaxID=354118 RepID=UPI0025FD0E6F|nr:FAD-dependent oxidoreductase [uncultured Victivallis sp.]
MVEMEKIVCSPGEVPVLADVDLCVAGGSCTGVFAAVTAARSGARVALVEAQNRFGGTAVASLVNYWHSLSTLDGHGRSCSV